MNRNLIKPFIKQFISYFFVGGISAIIEWVSFFLFSGVVNLHYLLSTFLAFIFSTVVNYCLGRVWTFKNNRVYENKRTKEVVLVFAVSVLGLLFNLLLMYFFVNIMHFNSEVLQLAAKVISTGIVFVWNFLGRKFLIYR